VSSDSKPPKRLDGDDERVVAITRAWDWVPLGLYDEIQRPAEQALGELIAEQNRLVEQLEALREAAERLRHYFDPAEMRWMSVEDSFIDVPARTVAEIGRALGSNPASTPDAQKGGNDA
jgi:hypothetical protein